MACWNAGLINQLIYGIVLLSDSVLVIWRDCLSSSVLLLVYVIFVKDLNERFIQVRVFFSDITICVLH